MVNAAQQLGVTRRSAPRVDFRRGVLLQPSGRPELVRAQTVNLGHGGMFVSATSLLEVDTELTFHLALPEDSIALRGRVAWVRAPAAGATAPAGMGIAFVDLSSGAKACLRQTLSLLLGERLPLNVEFVGHDLSLRAAGVINSDGVSLVAPLPFLRVGSLGRLSLRDDWRLEGKVRRVVYERGSTPRLRLELHVPELLDEPVGGQFDSAPIVVQSTRPTTAEPSVQVDLGRPEHQQTVQLRRPRKRRRRRSRQIALPCWAAVVGGVALLVAISTLATLVIHRL